ncbi:MAG: hypothetical protein KDC27_00295 [Acidobacteria bacterium]|nr:hypothetical protein [Acidobacteriota bacterium]
MLCALALAAATLAATTVERLSFGQVVAQSSAIVHGKVLRARSSWDAEHVAIWTHYDIQVRTSLKGRPGPVLTLSEPGGEADGKHMQVVGAPRYEVGEEVVVFVAPTATGLLRTCGWGQGKFDVRASGQAPSGRVVRSGVGAVTLVEPQGARAAKAAAAETFDGADLETFLGRIRAEVRSQQSGGVQ